MRLFDLEGFLTTVEKHTITDIAMVPPMVVAILMTPLSPRKCLGHLAELRHWTKISIQPGMGHDRDFLYSDYVPVPRAR